MATPLDLSGSLREVLPRIRAWLQQLGIENPGLEARILLAHTLGKKQHEIFSKDHLTLTEGQRQKLDGLLRQKSKGTPTAYLLGKKEFFSREFFVDPHVLIPRPETEELAEWVISENPQAGSLLDMCAGSGCLGITLALEIKPPSLVFVDLSPEALGVARKNAELLLDPKVNVRFIEGDLFEPVSGQKFDLVVSNPPYVLPDEYETLDPEVKDFEPQKALILPPGDFNTRFARGARGVMNSGAKIYIETGPRVIDELASELTEAGFQDVLPRKDLSGKWRFLSARA